MSASEGKADIAYVSRYRQFYGHALVTVSRLDDGYDWRRTEPPFSSLKPLLHFLTPALGLAMIRAIRFIGEGRLVCLGLHVVASART
jgi:hypothetical protein